MNYWRTSFCLFVYGFLSRLVAPIAWFACLFMIHLVSILFRILPILHMMSAMEFFLGGVLRMTCLGWTDTGPGAVNFIIEHAEIDFIFIQDKKVKEVSSRKFTYPQKLINCMFFFHTILHMKAANISKSKCFEQLLNPDCRTASKLKGQNR